MPMSDHVNLFGEPPATLLPSQPDAEALVASGTAPAEVAAKYPSFALAWAMLAEAALDANNPVAAYAYARTGYHRSLDALRRSGWKGHGPVPWSHEQNRGFLRSLAALARAAGEIEETEEEQRCWTFLADSSKEAYAELHA
jgi:hypothetical protein